MFDKIIYIADRSCDVKLKSDADITFNLMNLHVIFEDNDKRILGEVDDIKDDVVKVRFLGEITSRGLVGGVIRKPTLDAKVRVITKAEVPLVTGRDRRGYMLLGNSPFYAGKDVYMNVNGFFSNHFAIFGNSGSGKSCGVSRVFQNMFHDERLFPYKSNIIMFDSSAEYYNAFKNLSSINPNYNYRFISTNETEGLGEKLRIPIYLLDVDDITLLLNCNSHSQIPIIERMLKLAKIFSEEKTDANSYKNHLIAKAIMTILYTNETAPNKRNEIFSILASCSTPEFNLEAEVQGVGYTRKFRNCFLIDQFGNFTESVLVTEYISSFIKEEYDSYEPEGNVYYDLDVLEKALNFTLISEGWLRNENTYADAVTIKVRLHSLITGENSKYFEYENYVNLEQFVSSLLIVNGKKYQLVNINLDDVDDEFAKVIVKIFSRLVFSFSKSLGDRASIPFHLLVEEAHRYIQNDTDTFLLGYNIFDRIAKEGRKYGVILGLITQRPVEMSDTVISQCSNFLIFKMNHPADVDYIRKMVPNISEEIVEKQKTLQSGTCLAFGQAFTIPLIVKLEMPDPAPMSGNCDVVNIWDGNNGKGQEAEESDEEYVKKVLEEAKNEIAKESSTVVENKVEETETTIEEDKAPDEVETSEEVATELNAVIPQPIETPSTEDKNEETSDEAINSVVIPTVDITESEKESTAETNEVIPQPTVEIPAIPAETEENNSEQNTVIVPKADEEVAEVPQEQDSTTKTTEQENKVEISSDDLVIPIVNTANNEAKAENEQKDVPTVTSDQENISPIPEVDISKAVPEVATPLTPQITQTVNAAPVETPNVEAQAVEQPAAEQQPIVPEVNVFGPTVNTPANAENISISNEINSQESLKPDIKPAEEDAPSIIIPAGQGVDSSILEGFGGVAKMEEKEG